MGKWATSILVAGIFVLGACSGGAKNAAPASTDPSGSTAAPRTTTVPRSTTTTSTPEYSFDDSVPPPKLINTGTNYVAILESLDNYGNWLEAHRPDPALASLVLVQGSSLYERFTLNLAHLRDNSSRAIELVGRRPIEYTIVSKTPDAFSIRVVQDVLSDRTVTSGSKITSQVDYSAPTTYLALVVLIRSHWYVAAFDVQRSPHVHL